MTDVEKAFRAGYEIARDIYGDERTYTIPWDYVEKSRDPVTGYTNVSPYIEQKEKEEVDAAWVKWRKRGKSWVDKFTDDIL
jgi:hypothetical protein